MVLVSINPNVKFTTYKSKIPLVNPNVNQNHVGRAIVPPLPDIMAGSGGTTGSTGSPGALELQVHF